MENELTKRDIFAINAPAPERIIFDRLVSQLENVDKMSIEERHLTARVKWAYMFADAMIEESK